MKALHSAETICNIMTKNRFYEYATRFKSPITGNGKHGSLQLLGKNYLRLTLRTRNDSKMYFMQRTYAGVSE